MSSSTQLPSPENDYAAPGDPYLNRAFWDAALTSVGARIRALEAVKANWEELIAQGTGQALAVIQANVEPQLAALTAIIDQLKSDVAAAEDAIAVINAGGIEMAGVVGLSAALAVKADLTYVDAAIVALKGDAPAAYDTLVEIAAKLSEDDTAIAGLLAAVDARASKATKLKVGSGLFLDGIAGDDEEPAEGDLSVDRLLKLDLKALAGRLNNVRFITASGNVQPSEGVSKWLGLLVGGGANGGNASGVTASYGGGGGGGCLFYADVSDSEEYPVVIGGIAGTSSLVVGDATYSATGGAVNSGGAAEGGIVNLPGNNSSSVTVTGGSPVQIAIGGNGGDGPFGLGGGGGGGLVSNWTGSVGRPGLAATGYGAGGGGASGLGGSASGGAGTPGCLLLLEF